jgi:uncharacterized protein YbjT (DUF2867 family)
MILVTGAAGKTGREVILRLADTDTEVRAMVHAPEQVEPILALGASEGCVGDLLESADVSRAMEGVRAVYHICPNVHPREVEIGGLAIEAGAAAGVERFVLHSVLHPDVEAMPHHWLKFQVERKLRESGLAFTILQPCAYMQNLLAQIRAAKECGRLEVPYDVGAEISVVDLRDVAAAAATVLLKPGHEGRTYELCGPEPTSHRRMASELGTVVGRPVEAIATDLETWEARARSSGLGDYAIDALLKMFLWYDRHGFAGSSTDLESLLARSSTSFTEFVQGAIGRPGR